MHRSRFVGLLDFRDMGDGRHWQILDGGSYTTLDGMRITVPAGFVTDFASTPRVVWWLFPPTGEWDGGAVIHDWLYRSAIALTRNHVDEIFLEAMLDLDVNHVTAELMWLGVRCGGWRTWQRYRTT